MIILLGEEKVNLKKFKVNFIFMKDWELIGVNSLIKIKEV